MPIYLIISPGLSCYLLRLEKLLKKSKSAVADMVVVILASQKRNTGCFGYCTRPQTKFVGI